MPIFSDGDAATKTFHRLFSEARKDDRFVAGLRNAGITLLFEQRKPDCRIFVSHDEVLTGADTPDYATLVLKTSCDTAHSLWLNEITFPAAVTTGKLKILGKVSKVLEVMPALIPVFERYPSIAREADLSNQPTHETNDR